MKGYGGGATVMEIVQDYRTDTYRAFYTVKLADVVYVLHCIQKKSKTGIGLSQQDKETIARRLKIVNYRTAEMSIDSLIRVLYALGYRIPVQVKPLHKAA